MSISGQNISVPLKRGPPEPPYTFTEPQLKKQCPVPLTPVWETAASSSNVNVNEKQTSDPCTFSRAPNPSLEELQTENKLLRQMLAKYQEEITKKDEAESALLLALNKKQQDLTNLSGEVDELTKQSIPEIQAMRRKLLDPTWVLVYKAMRKELEEKNKKIENLQREVLGTGFTPYSITGKKLVAKLKALQTENEELGKQLCQGRVEQLQTALGIQKAMVAKLERKLEEADRIAVNLDRENEDMQATIFRLSAELQKHEERIGPSPSAEEAGDAGMSGYEVQNATKREGEIKDAEQQRQ